MKPTLYVIGTGGFAKEVAQLANEINSVQSKWRAIEYLCEREDEAGKSMPFGAVTGTEKLLLEYDVPVEYVVGIGNPEVRRRIVHRLAQCAHLSSPNLIHPMAGLDTNAVEIGHGNIVTRGTAFTCDIRIGDHNVFNLNSTVGHDTRVGSYCVINPGVNVSGGVTLGDACLLGTGSQVLEGLSIIAGTTLGAGSVAVKHISVSGVYVGVPARALTR